MNKSSSTRILIFLETETLSPLSEKYASTRSVFKVYAQVGCALRSPSIMGGIQNLIICVKMAWGEHLDCGVNIR